MSSEVPDPTPNRTRDDQGVERIADPDQYSHRRRLKQIHDAKERVLEVKTLAVERAADHKDPFSNGKRDQLVAEAVVDYISELEPVLQNNDEWDDFAAESVYDGNVEATIEAFLRTRGTNPRNNHQHYVYSMSMQAWRICNRYFEEVAGAEFEASNPAPEHNPVDPANRFNGQ